jgi:Na+-translocating ferredoxin:NAD+ oxidoreductase subunit G
MKEIIRLSFTLALTGLIAGLALSTTYSLTYDQILHQQRQAIFSAQKELFPQAEEFMSMELEPYAIEAATIDAVFTAMDSNGDLLGYLVNVSTQGYGGRMVFVVGFDLNNHIKGIQVTDQSETPGLGANVSRPAFLGQFANKSITDPYEIGEDVRNITASTITTRAMVQGIRSSIQWLKSMEEDSSS